MSEIEKIKNQFFSKLEEAKDLEKINQIKSELFKQCFFVNSSAVSEPSTAKTL